MCLDQVSLLSTVTPKSLEWNTILLYVDQASIHSEGQKRFAVGLSWLRTLWDGVGDERVTIAPLDELP